VKKPNLKKNIIATLLLQIQLQTRAINTFLHYFSFREKLVLICESVFCLRFLHSLCSCKNGGKKKLLKYFFLFLNLRNFLNVLIRGFSRFCKSILGPFLLRRAENERGAIKTCQNKGKKERKRVSFKKCTMQI